LLLLSTEGAVAGGGRAAVVQEGGVLNYDEIKAMWNMSCVTTMEAGYRLMGYKLFKVSSTIKLLAVHLEGERNVAFRSGEEYNAAFLNNRLSTLEAVMKYNRGPNRRFSQNIKYPDIPKHFTFTGR
jgi:hypothetical protein